MKRTAPVLLALFALAACNQHMQDPATAQAPVVTQQAPVPGIDDTATLFGLPPADVSALFGTPSLTRRDGPAQVWQYANARCVLDLFLYASADATPPQVTYIEAREHGAAAKDPLPCVRSFLRRPPEGA